jgi:hypothetical protein
MHITKTAGGSLIKTLLAAPSLNGKVIHTNTPSDPKNNFLGASVLFGHFGYGAHTITGRNPDYACFFRHPVTRTISHYYQLYQVEKGPVGEKIRAGGGDINSYFQNQYAKNTIHGEFSDQMNKMLLGIDKESSPGKNLYLAKQRLQNLKFIGIQEYYEISLIKLADCLKIPTHELAKNEKKTNATSWKLADIEEDTIKIIQEINHFDMFLYQDAIEKFLKV